MLTKVFCEMKIDEYKGLIKKYKITKQSCQIEAIKHLERLIVEYKKEMVKPKKKGVPV